MRILLLPGSYHSPSARFRIWQFVEPLRRLGHEVDVRVIIPRRGRGKARKNPRRCRRLHGKLGSLARIASALWITRDIETLRRRHDEPRLAAGGARGRTGAVAGETQPAADLRLRRRHLRGGAGWQAAQDPAALRLDYGGERLPGGVRPAAQRQREHPADGGGHRKIQASRSAPAGTAARGLVGLQLDPKIQPATDKRGDHPPEPGGGFRIRCDRRSAAQDQLARS